MSLLHRFEITQNKTGITLATAGKYCDRDIVVAANIDDRPLIEDATAQGKLVGRQEAYDEFWDKFQQNGNRRHYKYAFINWPDSIYNPKYSIVAAGDCSYAFNAANISKRIDIDVSACANIQGIFLNAAKVPVIGTIDTTGSPGYLAGCFNGCTSLVKIEKLKLLGDGSQTFSTSFFNGCNALKDIVIDGTIGNTLTMQYSHNLSKESITSVVNALSATASGKTLTFSASAKSNAFTDDEWATLIAPKSNWNISLV